jgi:hypothetical protein
VDSIPGQGGGDMSILSGSKLLQVFLLISVSFFPLNTFPSKGYCDDLVFISKNDLCSAYYDLPSLHINEQNHIISVRITKVFTDKGKIDASDKIKKIKLNPNDINREVRVCLYNYKEWKFFVEHITTYSNNGNILFSGTNKSNNWNDIKPNDYSDILLKKLLKDYNIQR